MLELKCLNKHWWSYKSRDVVEEFIVNLNIYNLAINNDNYNVLRE